MLLERFGERLAVVVVPGHAQRKGADAAQQQPGVERAKHRAGEHGDVPDLVRISAGPASTPADTSVWPLRYLVALCQTRSMPNSVGRWLRGVAKVLSARVARRAARAMVRDGAQVGDLQQRVTR